MSTIFGLYSIGILAELAISYLPAIWKIRKTLAIGLVIYVPLVTGYIAAENPYPLIILFVLVAIYRMVNLLRIVKGRMHESYLQRVFRRSSLWLNSLQLLFLIIALAVNSAHLPYAVYLFAGIQAAVGLAILFSTIHAILRARIKGGNAHYPHKDLPTVTVAIPARNEDQNLVECLEAVLKNTYPKLEILVYDDCSYERTDLIIKDFAQRGVRFISGNQPSDSWLAKNQAYESLTKNASGDYILFCGVDVRFGPDSILHFVETMLTEKIQMLSILPHRHHYRPLQQILQPLRYWWELAVPRYLLKQPPSLSTCWIIRKETAESFGGFSAVSRRVRPETYFARETHKMNAYKFAINTDYFAVTSLKQAGAQFATALRVRYPELHKRPESVFGLTVFVSLFFIAPFVMSTISLIRGRFDLTILFSLSCFALLATHLLIMRVMNRHYLFLGLLNYPFVACAEILLINESMRRYEFSEVNWKERNICLPVMHVTPHLPSLPEN